MSFDTDLELSELSEINNKQCMFLIIQYIRAKGSIYVPRAKKNKMVKNDLHTHNTIRIIRNELIHAYESASFREKRHFTDKTGKVIRDCESQFECISRHSTIGDSKISLPKMDLFESTKFISNLCVVIDLFLFLKEINYICYDNMGEDFDLIWNKFTQSCKNTDLPECVELDKYPEWSYPWISDPVMKTDFDYLNKILRSNKSSTKRYKSSSTHFFEAIRNYLVTSLKIKYNKQDNPIIFSKKTFLSKRDIKKNDILVIYHLLRVYGKPLTEFLANMVALLPTFKEKIPYKEKKLLKYEKIYDDDFSVVLPTVFASLELHNFLKSFRFPDLIQQTTLYLDFIGKICRSSWR